MPFLLKGEGAVFLVSLMIGYLNADVSVKTKSDDYSSKHCFPPCHLLPSPSSSGLAFCQHLQVGDLACCIFWTLSPFPLPHCKKNTQLKVVAQFCINPLKRAQLDAAGGLTSIRLVCEDQSLRHPSKHQASTPQHFSTWSGFPA